MPKISVIIPVYNNASYLNKCFETISAQTFGDFEVLLIDDCSTDGSRELCREYIQKDQRFRLIEFEHNRGVSAARNTAIENAIGEWIVPIDSDDWIETDMFERLMEKATENEPDILAYDFFFDYPISNKCVAMYRADKDRFLSEEHDLTICRIRVLAPVWFRYGEYRGGLWDGSSSMRSSKRVIYSDKVRSDERCKIRQDNLETLLLLEEAKSVQYIHTPFYHYRRNYASATRRYKPGDQARVLPYLHGVAEYIQKFHPGDELYHQAFCARVIDCMEAGMQSDFCHLKNPKPAKERIADMEQLFMQEPYLSAAQEFDLAHCKGIRKLSVTLMKKKCWTLLDLIVRSRLRIKQFSDR